MIDLNTFMARATDMLSAASTSAYVRCIACSDSITVARALTALGYLEWGGGGWHGTEYRWRITDAGRAWFVEQRTEEHDEPSALDALCYRAEPDGLDDRTWAIGMGGR